MAIDIGRIAFEEYILNVGNKTYDGKEIPSWENLTKTIQDAWRAAAVAVIDYVLEEQEKI